MSLSWILTTKEKKWEVLKDLPSNLWQSRSIYLPADWCTLRPSVAFFVRPFVSYDVKPTQFAGKAELQATKQRTRKEIF